MCVMKCVIPRYQLFIYFLSASLHKRSQWKSGLAERERAEESSIKVEHNYPDINNEHYIILYFFLYKNNLTVDQQTIRRFI